MVRVERVKLLDGSVVGLRRLDARDFDAVLLLHKNLTAEWLTPYIRDIAVLAVGLDDGRLGIRRRLAPSVQVTWP